MKNLRNKVQLIGNLGMDPVIKDFNGNKQARFSLATNEYYKDTKGERQTDTQWHNLVAWGKLAETVEKHVTKGKEILIEGRLNTRSYEDAEGHKKYITEIIVNDILFTGTKS